MFRCLMIGTVAWVCCWASAAAGAESANWPQFRGPAASGVGAGTPPAEWDVKSGKNVQWRVEVPGLSHASPIAWGEHIFLTTAECKGGGESFSTGWLNGTGDSAADEGPWTWAVLCLDRATGKTIWRQDAYTGAPRQKRHVKATHNNSTPATDGKHIVAFFGSEGLYCFDVDGKLLWKKDLGVIEAGPYNAPEMQWGVAASPIIHEGRVILQVDQTRGGGYWAAFDIATGKEVRRVPREDVCTWSTPAIAAAGGKPLLVCNGYQRMAGYDLESGEERWTLRDGGDVPVPTPLVAHGLVYLTNSHGGRSPIYAIKPDAKGDLTPIDDKPGAGLAWYTAKGGSYMPTPLIVDGLLYVGDDDGRLRVFDALGGEKVYARRLPGGAGTYSASAVAAGGRIYYTSEDGVIHVIRAGREYQKLASNEMGSACMATPAISDGTLLVRTQRHLFALRGQ